MRGRFAALNIWCALMSSVEPRLDRPLLLAPESVAGPDASEESSPGDDERVSEGGDANMPALGWTWAGEIEMGGINDETAEADDEVEEVEPLFEGWKANMAS